MQLIIDTLVLLLFKIEQKKYNPLLNCTFQLPI